MKKDICGVILFTAAMLLGIVSPQACQAYDYPATYIKYRSVLIFLNIQTQKFRTIIFKIKINNK